MQAHYWAVFSVLGTMTHIGSDSPASLLDGPQNCGHPFGHASRGNGNHLEPELRVSVLMRLLKPQGFFVADSACFRRRNKTQGSHKEDKTLENAVRFDPFEFPPEGVGEGKSEVPRQSGGADHRAIMEMNVARKVFRTKLALPLEFRDCIKKSIMPPRFRDAARLLQCDHIRRCLLYNSESVQFQLTNDRSFS